MRALLITVGVVGLIYVVSVPRRFDLLAMAFLSTCLYATPGFLGFAAYPIGPVLFPVPLVPEAYAVMIALLAVNLAFMVAVDAMNINAGTAVRPLLRRWPWEAWIATALGLMGLAITIVGGGSDLLSPEKTEVMEKLGRGYILWTTGATVGFVGAVLARSRVALALCAAMLLTNLLVGFRAEFVVALLAVTYLFLANSGVMRFGSHWRLGLGLFGLGLAMIVLKGFLFAIKLADPNLIASLAANSEVWRLMFANSEPFITQGILNEVLVSNFQTSASQLLDAGYLLVPFAENLGAEVHSFNAQFQPALFSSVTEYGLANNFWAQMWSAGGWALLAMAICSYFVLLVWLDRLCARSSSSWRAVIALAGVYLAFYIHRNDLVYELTLERRVIVFGAVAVAAAGVCRGLARVGEHTCVPPAEVDRTANVAVRRVR